MNIYQIPKIDFESHHSTGKWIAAMAASAGSKPPPPEEKPNSQDPFTERVQLMEKCGVRTAFISTAGGLEGFPMETAIDVAKSANDEFYALGQKNPGRWSGYASLIPQSVGESLKELRRCHDELGFIAWNTHTNFTDTYIDDDEYFPLLELAEQLGMFVYLHPGPPSIDRLKGFGVVLNAGLGYHVDGAITLSRLICKGVFDRLPKLRLMLGHYGEAMPFMLDRIDSFATQHEAGQLSHGGNKAVNEHAFDYYFRHNIYVTTSGNFSPAAFHCTKERLGIDRMLFGTDYPIESYEQTIDFLDSVGMTQIEKEMLFCKNAEELLA